MQKPVEAVRFANDSKDEHRMVEVRQLDPILYLVLLQGVRACYLLRDRSIALIDSGFPADVPDLASGLARIGLSVRDLEVLVLTHAHADHGGGAGHLFGDNPNLTVYAHPKAVRHLREPARLNEAVRRAYGSRFNHVGPLRPIPDAKAIRPVETGDVIDLGARKLRVFESPGHCKHHIVLHDEASAAVFSGDALGSKYAGLPNFVLSPPSDYDPSLAKRSVEQIKELRPRTIYFAHNGPYGPVDLPDFLERLKSQHDLWVETVRSLLSEDPSLEPEQALKRFLEKRPELRGYESQYFSFTLSVRGIMGFLRNNTR